MSDCIHSIPIALSKQLVQSITVSCSFFVEIITTLLLQLRMFIKILFVIYILLLLAYILYAGLNYYRIQSKGWMHPQVITNLTPFVVNFLLANFVFKGINPLMTTLFPCLLIYFIGSRLQKLRIFGLTGGIACGKSTLVKQMVENIGNELAIIDCDKINTDLRDKGRAGYNLILTLLNKHGEDTNLYINTHTKQIKRQALSKYSFQHPSFLRQLAGKLGKYIMLQIFKQIVDNYSAKKKLILIDAPTLFQTKILTHICFPIIVVGCDQKIQVQRMVKTRSLTEEQAKLRIKSQMPLTQKKKRADVYVENNGSPGEMFTKTLRFVNNIMGINKK